MLSDRLQDHHSWSPYEERVFDRIIEARQLVTWRNRCRQGLLATCLTLRMLPAIRFTGACELTRQLAHRLEADGPRGVKTEAKSRGNS